MNDLEHNIYLENCQKLLRIVGVLFSRGYVSVYPIPCIREGTGRWQLFLFYGDRFLSMHHWFADLGKPEFQYDEYEKMECPLTIEQLADRFIEDHREWLEGTRSDSGYELFIEWYQLFLTTLKTGDSPYATGLGDNAIWHIENVQSQTGFRVFPTVIPCNFASLGLSHSLRLKLFLIRITKKCMKKILKK